MDVITSYHWQLLQVTLCWNRVKGPVVSLQHWQLYIKRTMVLWEEQLGQFTQHTDPLHLTRGRDEFCEDTVKDDTCAQQTNREEQKESMLEMDIGTEKA